MKIVTNLPFSPEQWNVLCSFEGVEWVEFNKDPEMLAPIGNDVEVFYPRHWTNYERALELCPNLKWLGLMSVGYNMVPAKTLKERGITLTNMRGVGSKCIAEDVVLKVLLLARRYRRYFDDMHEHRWIDFAEIDPRIVELSEQTVAVLGAGSIGTEIAKRLRAFEMKVIAYDPFPPKSEYYDEIYSKEADIPTVLAQADYVISSLPLLENTHQFFNKERFSMMKPTAFFINTARGPLVNEPDLAEALQNGVIAGAALDVVDVEPLSPDSTLWDAPNIILTPHQAFFSNRTEGNKLDTVYEMFCRYLRGEPLFNTVKL